MPVNETKLDFSAQTILSQMSFSLGGVENAILAGCDADAPIWSFIDVDERLFLGFLLRLDSNFESKSSTNTFI